MKVIILAISIFATTASVALCATFEVSGTCEFVAIGKPSSLKIKGQGEGLSGEIKTQEEKITGSITFPLSHFATGVELRDKHMKEKYLETQKFPDATLSLKDCKVADLTKEGLNKKQIPFEGALLLHGVTHSVSGQIDLTTSKNVTEGDAEFDLKISDYNIPVPKYLGITVADLVHVRVHLEAKPAANR